MRTLYIIKRTLLLLFLVSFPYSIYGQAAERIYLQTDKQLYIVGELIWLKAYTTDIDGKLQEFSKIGYIELLSDSKPEVQIKLDIKNGVGVGWMELPSMLATGNYRLSAYTRYMRNEGESVFFEKIITVINPLFQQEDGGAIQSTDIVTEAMSHSNTVQLGTNKMQFVKREKGMITINGLPEEYASLAVSVTGEVPFSHENRSIGDWKSNIRQPIRSNIDGPFSPEYEGAIISAQLINNKENTPKATHNANTILTFPGKEMQVYGGQGMESGVYNFYTQEITGKAELSMTVFPDYEDIYRLDIQSPFSSSHPYEPLPPLYLNRTWKDYLSMRNLSSQVVRTYTVDSINHFSSVVPFNDLAPTKQYILDEYTRFSSIEETFTEFIYEARIRKIDGKRTFSLINDAKKGYTLDYVLVLLDNMPVVDHDFMCNYNAALVKKINIHLGRHIYGNNLYSGIIHFVTDKGNYPNIKFEDYTQIVEFEGTQPYRYFYSPTYDGGDNITRMPDFRHTLLWEPLVESRDAKSITIPFYTSDISGKYDVKVEGISKEGKIISATLQIEVVE